MLKLVAAIAPPYTFRHARAKLSRRESPTYSLLSHKGSGQTHRLSKPRQRDTHKQLQKKTLMDKQNLMPQAAQPVNRTTTGQLPDVLAELSEEALQLHGDEAETAAVFASGSSFERAVNPWACSYDGDDAE